MSSHLRDCKAWKDEKMSMSTTSNDAAKLFDDVLRQYVTWKEDSSQGGIEGTLKMMFEADPNFVMGKVLSKGFELMTGQTIRLDTGMANDIKNIEKYMESDAINTREKLHCKAICKLANEEYASACDTWEDILVEYPKDILALRFAHDSYFYLGNSIMIRDSVGRVLPYWEETDPLYGYLKGMFAFGLEEMNMYNLAERHATEALTINPTDCWATHARAHCFEMTGRSYDGIEFMSKTESDWIQGAWLAGHNYWHWALYCLENGRYDDAIALYDEQIERRADSGAMLDIVDAASLLKRFEFEGVNVGDRWNKIYDLSRPHIDDHIHVLNDAHFLMAYLGARESKGDIVNTFMESVSSYIAQFKGSAHDIMEKVGVKLFQAIIAYSEERFDDAVELLHPLKYNVIMIGGSHAQRDVFNQLLLHACIQSKKLKNLQLGRALLHERKVLKENSLLTDRMFNKMMACHV